MATGFLEDYYFDYLVCRTFGHAWEEFVPVGMRKPVTGYRMSLHCHTCGTERHDSIDVNGNVGSRRYYYPEGYKLGGKFKRNEARRVYRKRRRREGMVRF
jgi:hypothetical protein